VSAVDRSQTENHVLVEMARLATARYEYADVVAAVLDLLEEVVSCPFVQLVVDEGERAGCYHRAQQDAEMVWREEIRAALAPKGRGPLPRASLPYSEEHFPQLDSWAASVGVTMRSGRWGVLTLASPGPLDLSKEEVHLLSRLTQQAVLVLDHALLVARMDEMQADDSLTGVLSHGRLLELLEMEIARHRFFRRPLAVVMVDVDGLDTINRSYGRRYGNHVLQKLAAVLREASRPVDIVARCGLDEFAVVLLETGQEGAEPFAQTVRERLMGVEFAGGEVRVTVVGTQMRPDEGLAAEDLLHRGEEALAAAKRQMKALSGALGARGA
jgi:diguanylate cyclase (GGDEF)-like protein